ncbi:MAG: plasmid mobilization relaxosome protein MobC [Proteobacteria bacterium]|nr:MAG: plasmid mobilization relaxosome protein MobC [Pseudomonadota bacterium]
MKISRRKRVKNKKLWLTEEEDQNLIEAAKVHGETVAGYLRRLGLGQPAPPPREEQEFNRDLLVALARGLNNLNQIAHAANKGNVDLSTLKELQFFFREKLEIIGAK